MDKLEYIPGDLVMVDNDIVKVMTRSVNYFLKIINNYDVMFHSGNVYKYSPNELKPIPLTPEILEKNGWAKEVMSRGVKNSHWVYTKPDIEEYGYFPIYIEKGIGDEFDVYPFTGNNVCTQIAYIKYVHQLQHLLNHSNLSKKGKVYMTNNSLLMLNNSYDYIAISVRKGTKIHDILEKEMPLKGVERSYGAEVCYRVPKSEFEKEEL